MAGDPKPQVVVEHLLRGAVHLLEQGARRPAEQPRSDPRTREHPPRGRPPKLDRRHPRGGERIERNGASEGRVACIRHGDGLGLSEADDVERQHEPRVDRRRRDNDVGDVAGVVKREEHVGASE